jgi:RNA polymerase sigma-70 factor (ECF subfamily)
MFKDIEQTHLFQKAQAGTTSAYEKLIHHYTRLVWAVIYGIVNNSSAIEDLVQETFLKSWQVIKTLREPEKFRGWLVMIARRNALQHNRKLCREDQSLKELASTSDVNLKTSDKSSYENEELRRQLHKTLSELPERYRLPITLRHMEGLSYTEISKTLGLSDGSLRGLLNRGMKILRNKFLVHGPKSESYRDVNKIKINF